MSSYAELESAALAAEYRHNWLHAADLWKQAASVAISTRLQQRCLDFEIEARQQAEQMARSPA